MEHFRVRVWDLEKEVHSRSRVLCVTIALIPLLQLVPNTTTLISLRALFHKQGELAFDTMNLYLRGRLMD